jgi:predicted dehydrogenase/serine acetyltransferase
MKKLGVAVIGCGYWGKKLISEYISNENSNYELVAVCDASKPATDDTNVPERVTKTNDILDICINERIEAVHIATPLSSHYDIAKQMLKCGKHVLLEKPMCKTSEEAQELVALASKNGLVLKVGHIFRFSNTLRKIKEMVESGKLGNILMINMTWATPWEAMPTGRDALYDFAPHPVDMLNFIFSEWPVKTSCISRELSLKRKGLGEVAHMILEFSDGKFADINLSWVSADNTKTRKLEIFGTSANIIAFPVEQELYIWNKETKHKTKIDIANNNTIGDEILDFTNMIKLGTGTSSNSGLIGARTIAIIEAAKKSHETERVVDINNSAISTSAFSKIKDVNMGENTKIYDQVNLYGCKIGNDCKIDSFVYIEGGVEIGNYVKIRPFVFIPTGVKIGNNVFVGPGVTFTNDKYPKLPGEWELRNTIIEDGVSIGAGAVILPGIRIGENSLVGAGAVVTSDVPKGSVFVGNPARKIK